MEKVVYFCDINTNKNMQTSIDWLMDQYVKDNGIFLAGVYEQAKEMEKKQHETTFHRGINIGAFNPELDIEGRKESAKHYYETTFDKVDNQKELIVVDNEELTPKCYVVVSCSMNEGYYFDNSYVFKNRMDAEKYIEQLDSEDTFDIIELNYID